MRALKQIPKAKLKEPERLKTEIEILKTLVRFQNMDVSKFFNCKIGSPKCNSTL